MLTKQDLQKIAEYIKRLSVKDTDFPTTSFVDGDTKVPVIQDSRNKLAEIATIAAYVIANIDISSLKLHLEGVEGNTLIGILEVLKSRIENGNFSDEVYASNVLYKRYETDESNTNVASVLNDLYNLVEGLRTDVDNFEGLDEDQLELLNKITLFLASIEGIDFSKLKNINFDTLSIVLNNYSYLKQAADDFKSNEPGYQTQDQVTSAIQAAIQRLNLETLHIKDNLESTDSDWALSANQGRVLKQAVMDLTNALANLAFKDGIPYTAGLNWQIEDPVWVTVKRTDDDIMVKENDPSYSEYSYAVTRNESIKIPIWPKPGTFLSSLEYKIGSINRWNLVRITDTNKTKAIITIAEVTDDMEVTVKGDVNAPQEFTITYPENPYPAYFEFYPKPTSVTEEQSVTIGYRVIPGTTVPDSITVTGMIVKMENGDDTTAGFNSVTGTCQVTINKVVGDLNVLINVLSADITYRIYGLQTDLGYRWTDNSVGGRISANARYTCTIIPLEGSTIRLVAVNHAGSTMYPQSVNGNYTFEIELVTSDITITVHVKTETIEWVQVKQSAETRGLTLITEELLRKGGTYTGTLELTDPENTMLPDVILIEKLPDSIDIVPSSGNVPASPQILRPGPTTFASSKYIPENGYIEITELMTSILITAYAEPKEQGITQRRIALKLMNIEHSDTTNITDPDFEYPVIYLRDTSNGYSVTLSPKTGAIMNDDVTVKIGGVTKFRQRTEIETEEDSGIFTENGITYTVSSGVLSISQATLDNVVDYPGRINIIATANTGKVIIKSTSSISYSINGISGTETSEVIDGNTIYTREYDVSSDGVLTSVPLFSSVTNNIADFITSVDYGGVPIVENSAFNNKMSQVLQKCDNLLSVKGMIVRGNITSVTSTFLDTHNLTEIEGLYAWDVSLILSIALVFSGCGITKMDLEDWETTAALKNTISAISVNTTVLNIGNFDTSGLDTTWSTTPQAFLFDHNNDNTGVSITCIAAASPGISSSYNWIKWVTDNNWKYPYIHNSTIYVPDKTVYENSNWNVSEEITFVSLP